jgi:murein DD-endopeptidase MepM/ murein hydrolase activator NlpD
MLTSILSVTVLLLSNAVANINHNNDITMYYGDFEKSSTIQISASNYEPIQRESWLLDIQYPVDDYENTTSGFGSRNLECSKCSTFHKGLDFTPGRGSPVYAVMDGVVIEVKNSGQYGVHVILEHRIHEDLVYHTVYAHLQDRSLTTSLPLNQKIDKGSTIGSVGSTGLSTGAHLHFEIRENGVFLNPVRIFEKNIIETK